MQGAMHIIRRAPTPGSSPGQALALIHFMGEVRQNTSAIFV